jgi:ParB-like chromosome segregation protein Spo0J
VSKQITHLKDLTSDPRNARKHNSRNIGLIERSLNEVGAARSIVVDEDGLVLAGNATIEAAVQAGIERVRVVEADGNEIIAVRRTGLTDEQKIRLALYDNRTAETSVWDDAVLAHMADQGLDLSPFFTTKELEERFARMPLALEGPAPALGTRVLPDVDADEDAAPEVLPPSYVRMVQLFLTSETQPQFLQLAQALMPVLGQDNITDTVFEAVNYAYRTLVVPDAG